MFSHKMVEKYNIKKLNSPWRFKPWENWFYSHPGYICIKCVDDLISNIYINTY